METAVANARASEAERHRAKALAVLDRAETVFFHAFRTPLTFILGTAEDTLAQKVTDLSPGIRSQLELVYRTVPTGQSRR